MKTKKRRTVKVKTKTNYIDLNRIKNIKPKYIFIESEYGDYKFDTTPPEGYEYCDHEIDDSTWVITHIYKLIE